MNDMSSAIAPKSDQLNADDLISGPRTIVIRDVNIRATPEQPVSIYFDGDDGKPWKPCKSMSRVLVAAWGPDAKRYVGRSATLYRDPKVKWGGLEVGGIRISHLSDIERDMILALTETRGKRAPYKVNVLTGQPSASREGAGLEDARAAINAATTLDELKTTWLKKAMAPFRETLQSELEARKVALSSFDEGPSDTDRGESHNGMAADLIARIEAADSEGLTAITDNWFAGENKMFDDGDVGRIEAAIDARKAEL